MRTLLSAGSGALRVAIGAGLAAGSLLLAGCAASKPTAAEPTLAQMAASAAPSPEEARAQVRATEEAFARSMAERNLQAFADFVADDSVFFSGPAPLHGKAAVLAFWQRFFSAPAAPFSWSPQQVEVLAAGDLALSTGPVRDPAGRVIGCYSSIWRLEASGRWRIVFDRGGAPADCETTH